jgi:DNA-binding Lrp family transcriptional regulator
MEDHRGHGRLLKTETKSYKFPKGRNIVAYQMSQQELDSLDIEILEDLMTCGPRNLAKVARKAKISPTTLHYRLKTLTSHFSLKFFTNIYHVNLGLKKAIIMAEAQPGQEELLLNCLKANGFWIYLAPMYGAFQGYVGVYTIPINHTEEFEKFLNELENVGVARTVQHIWTTSLRRVNLSGAWFDSESEKWLFQFEDWIKEISGQSTELPYTLQDPEQFPILTDEMDVFILKELEKNALVSFTELAERIGITPQAVRYRYSKLSKLKLIEGFEIHLYPFQNMPFEAFYFVLAFGSHEKFAKFAASLLNKPFVVSLGKILGQNSMIAFLYVPLQEFKGFIKALSKLRALGLLQNYSYVHLDLDKDMRQTFSYEYFKQGTWSYNHEEHISAIQNLSKPTIPENLEKSMMP